MKKENILVAALICIAVAGVMLYNTSKSEKFENDGKTGTGQTAGADGIDWQAYTPGMALAKTEGKPIFLYFHADWCTYCKQLKKTTFQNKEVLNYLSEHFISISVDTDKNKNLADQWQVKGLPTLWFLEPDGKKISHIPGYVDEKQFIQILTYIHTKSYSTMNFHDFVKTL